jgi:hypothetical protein
MAWQDELNSLDEELSAGRIKPDEYRRRRDELLAAASSSNQIGLRRGHRQQPPSIANAFNGDANPKSQGDVTQQVKIPSPAPAWQATPPPPSDAPPPNAPRPITSPPTPPVQGSEVFGLSMSGPSASRKPWPKFVIAVLVLALVAGGIWWFAFRSGDEPDPAVAGAPNTAADFTVDRVPNPTDVPLTTSGVLTVDQAQIYNLLKPAEAAYLSEGGTERIFYRGVTAGNVGYLIFVFQTKDTATGKQLAQRIVDVSKANGHEVGAISDAPAGVTTTKLVVDKAAILEAVYPADRAAVRVVLLQTGEVDEGQLANALRRATSNTVRAINPVR